MTPESLLLLLRETGDEIPCGPVRSVRAIAAEADRRRRFRWVTASAATTATAAAVAVLVVVPQLVAPSPPAPEPVLPLLPPSPAPLPADSPCPRAAGTDGEHQLVVVESSCNLSFYADAGRKLTYPALSPTGATVAFVTYQAGDAQLKVRDLTSGEDWVLATSSDTIGDPVWSRDGEMLAFWLNDGGGHPQVHVVQASGGGVAAVSAPDVNAAFPAWSPDGTAIAYSWQKTVVVVDLDTGSERSLEQAPVRVSSPFWASTDSRVLYVLQSSPGAPTERFRVLQLDAETGATRQTSDWIDGQSTDGVSDAFGLHVAALAGGRDPATTITTLDNNLEIVSTRAVPGVHLYNVPPRPGPAGTDPSAGANSGSQVAGRLEGTWTATLSGITSGENLPNAFRDTTFTLTFERGRITGTDGCNDFGGDYTLNGQDLRFGPIESTLVGCDSTATMLDVLSQVRHATGAPNKAYLHADHWGILIALTPVSQ